MQIKQRTKDKIVTMVRNGYRRTHIAKQFGMTTGELSSLLEDESKEERAAKTQRELALSHVRTLVADGEPMQAIIANYADIVPEWQIIGIRKKAEETAK